MEPYISKSALVAEIKRRLGELSQLDKASYEIGLCDAYKIILSTIDTLEVKDANEALRTEYEKGRADVIVDTLSWLENCWPQYCSNQTIIEGFKEAIKE